MIEKIKFPLATETWSESEYKSIQRVIDSGRFTMGKEVKAFEEKFAAFFGSKYAVMVNSGSSANLLAIAAMIYDPRKFLKPGDQVIVPAVSWSTTFYPVHQYGLELRFVDIDPETLNFNLDLVEKAITPKTKAIFAVHLLGNPCQMDKLQELCEKHGLILLEDNCESMGAKYKGKYTGTFGKCGTFSTFFSHHISTMEGGVIVTDDETVYHSLLSLRAHGWTREQPENSHLKVEKDPFLSQFRFVLPGYNLRPLEMSGAIGQEQLLKLDGFVKARRENASVFKSILGNLKGIKLQKEVGESSWFGFSMVLTDRLINQRAALVNIFNEYGVECRPIVTGNFLSNPVINLLNYSVGSEIVWAEHIDRHGLFVGNQHFPIKEQIEKVEQVVQLFLRKFSN